MANLHISNSGALEFRASIWADHFGSRDGANVSVLAALSFAGALSSLIAAAFGARHREPMSRTRF